MKVMLYDTTEGFLSFLWSAGQYLGNFDEVLAAASWDEAYTELSKLKKIDQLQFWGHGISGSPLINSRKIKLDKFLESVDMKDKDSVVWFRACDVFGRNSGVEFAESIASQIGCKVVGHTRVVSAPWPTHQSGGYGLYPDQEPYWDPEEGLKKDGTSKGSNPFAPNTCSVFKMNPPKRWFI